MFETLITFVMIGAFGLGVVLALCGHALIFLPLKNGNPVLLIIVVLLYLLAGITWLSFFVIGGVLFLFVLAITN